MYRHEVPFTMRTTCFTAIVLIASAAAFWANGMPSLTAQQPAPEEKTPAGEMSDKAEIRARLKCMRERVAGISTSALIGDASKRLEGPKEPLFRLVDPTRDYPDGTLWAWSEKGRPTALVTLSLLRNSEPPVWVYEFASLSESLIEAEYAGKKKWSALRSGWEPKAFLEAPEPASAAPQRLRQMRELARRFKAVELLPTPTPAPTRFELRLLPQPVLRYADHQAGQLDGAIFLLCLGTNPEIILAIESTQEKDQPARYQYAFARNTIAELHVALDGKEVWTQPYVNFADAYVDGPYSVAVDPVSDNELSEIDRGDAR